MPPSPLITVDQLEAAFDRATIVDASWIYGPFNHAGIDVRRRYAQAHIRGSWFLDLAALSDPARKYDARVDVLTPPRPGVIRTALAHAGAIWSSLVVVTDMDGGCTTAPFARHALLEAGFLDVRLLAGGTPAWCAAGGELTDAGPRYLGADLVSDDAARAPARAGGSVFATHAELMRALDDPAGAQIVDSRAVASNQGVLPADYEGLEVPASAFVPSTGVVEELGAGLQFKSAGKLGDVLRAAGIDPGRPMITTCYFGVGASVVATALEIAGFGSARVHAGSLVEYAARNRLIPRHPPAGVGQRPSGTI